MQLELGGKSPNIVFDDADFAQAVAGGALGVFYNQGENCNAGSRLLVHASIYDAYIDALSAAAQKIRILPPLDEKSQMGALISAAHRDKVAGYVELGREEDLTLRCGGTAPGDGHFQRGHWYLPTVLADVKPTHRVFQEEIFGPVCTVTEFHDEDEAIALANGTAFCLAAGAWTKSVHRAPRCRQELQSGYVWINNYNRTPVEAPPRRREVVRLRARLRAASDRGVHDVEVGAVVARAVRGLVQELNRAPFSRKALLIRPGASPALGRGLRW